MKPFLSDDAVRISTKIFGESSVQSGSGRHAQFARRGPREIRCLVFPYCLRATRLPFEFTDPFASSLTGSLASCFTSRFGVMPR
jgi:hypothetical protein